MVGGGLRRMALWPLALLLATVRTADAANIVVFAPAVSSSNLIFFNNVADALVDAGHSVTVYMAQVQTEAALNRTQFVGKAKPLLAPGDDGTKWDELERQMNPTIFREMAGEQWDAMELMAAAMRAACEAQLASVATLSTLRSSRFDLAIGHQYDLCWLGITEMVGIDTVVWAASVGMEPTYEVLAGVPPMAGFVPGLMTPYGDEMTFYERAMNLVDSLMMRTMLDSFYGGMNAVFRRHVRADFPDLVALARAKTQLFVLNGIDLLEFPRPMFKNFVNVGGLAIKKAKPLDEKWSKVYEEAKAGVIFVSFGSVASAHSMPASWKGTIVRAAKALPDYTVVWKYDSDDIYELFDVPENVIVAKWLPQKDMLAHPKTAAFVTHGGQNSLVEAAGHGAPVLMVPLFGDQQHNAAIACRRHKIGECVDRKADMAERPQVFVDKLKKVVGDKSYRENARLLSAMLQRRPDPPEHTLQQWVGFVAEFRRLDAFKSASRHMALMQITSLDVVVAAIAAVHCVLIVAGVLVFVVVRKCCRGKGVTMDGKKKDN